MRTQLHTLTNATLETEYAKYVDHTCTYEDACPECRHMDRIEHEQEARENWTHEDARVREAAGNPR